MQPCHCFVLLWLFQCLFHGVPMTLGTWDTFWLHALSSYVFRTPAPSFGLPDGMGAANCALGGAYLFKQGCFFFWNTTFYFCKSCSFFSNKMYIFRTPSQRARFAFPQRLRPYSCTVISLVRYVSLQRWPYLEIQFFRFAFFSDKCYFF